MDRIGVIFVCLGNICRSPMAKGVFQAKVNQRGVADRFEIESAGTSSYHVGERPDEGAIRAAGQMGVDISGDRSRRITREDLSRFQYVIALDRHNRSDLLRLGPGYANRIRLLREFEDGGTDLDVPDPWGEGYRSFVRARDIIDRATTGFLEFLLERHPELG